MVLSNKNLVLSICVALILGIFISSISISISSVFIGVLSILVWGWVMITGIPRGPEKNYKVYLFYSCIMFLASSWSFFIYFR